MFVWDGDMPKLLLRFVILSRQILPENDIKTIS